MSISKRKRRQKKKNIGKRHGVLRCVDKWCSAMCLEVDASLQTIITPGFPSILLGGAATQPLQPPIQRACGGASRCRRFSVCLHKRAPRFGRLERAPNGSGARPEVATPCALWSTSSSSSTACTEGWHSSHSRRREGAWALDDRPGCVRARFVFAVSSARLGKSPERGASKSSQRAFSAGSRGI